MAKKAKRMQAGDTNSYTIITHLGSKRTVPIKTFDCTKVVEAVHEHLAELESKL